MTANSPKYSNYKMPVNVGTYRVSFFDLEMRSGYIGDSEGNVSKWAYDYQGLLQHPQGEIINEAITYRFLEDKKVIDSNNWTNKSILESAKEQDLENVSAYEVVDSEGYSFGVNVKYKGVYVGKLTETKHSDIYTQAGQITAYQNARCKLGIGFNDVKSAIIYLTKINHRNIELYGRVDSK